MEAQLPPHHVSPRQRSNPPAPKVLPGPWRHGRPATYNRGCRCDECRACQRARYAAWKQRVVAQGWSRELQHGKSSTYTNYNCRCAACTAAHSQTFARLRAKARKKGASVHGTITGYRYFGCRCEACRDAAKEVNRKRLMASARKEPRGEEAEEVVEAGGGDEAEVLEELILLL